VASGKFGRQGRGSRITRPKSHVVALSVGAEEIMTLRKQAYALATHGCCQRSLGNTGSSLAHRAESHAKCRDGTGVRRLARRVQKRWRCSREARELRELLRLPTWPRSMKRLASSALVALCDASPAPLAPAPAELATCASMSYSHCARPNVMSSSGPPWRSPPAAWGSAPAPFGHRVSTPLAVRCTVSRPCN
jgi:hypothetical protein